MAAIHLTAASLLILKALDNSQKFGFEIMSATGLPSGTVYPALKRFEQRKFVRSKWEDGRTARLDHRPARCYYELTKTGRNHLRITAERFAEA